MQVQLFGHPHPVLLRHVHHLWAHTVRKSPVKVVQEASQSNLDIRMREIYAGAHSSSNPERSELKIESLEVEHYIRNYQRIYYYRRCEIKPRLQ